MELMTPQEGSCSYLCHLVRTALEAWGNVGDRACWKMQPTKASGDYVSWVLPLDSHSCGGYCGCLWAFQEAGSAQPG